MADERGIDDLLAAAGQSRMAPSDALMARILADADALQPEPPPALPIRQTGPRPAVRVGGLWDRLVRGLGPVGALASLGAAAVTGLTFGLLQPSALSLVTGGYITTESADSETSDAALFPDMTLFMTEDQG